MKISKINYRILTTFMLLLWAFMLLPWMILKWATEPDVRWACEWSIICVVVLFVMLNVLVRTHND